MPWESEEEKDTPRRDWTMYMWLAIGVLIVLGMAAMFVPWQRGGGYQVTRARVSHILVKFDMNSPAAQQAAIEKANKLRDEILKGANFAKLAAEQSDDTGSAAKGGDLGWVQRGELSKLIDEYVWSAPLNKVSQPFLSSSGIHLVIVREREVSEADKYEAQLKERVLKGEAPAGTPKP